jgi:hypothetical protein
MKQHKIKPLSGRKADLIARIKGSSNFGIGNKYIYENDIKISPVYIQKEMPISKQTVAQLKQMLKQAGLKVSGNKPELIKRLVDAGASQQPVPMPIKSKKSSTGVRPYEKMTIVELKPILKKYKLSVAGKKGDLVARLYDYDSQRESIEMGMMGTEDAHSQKHEIYQIYKNIAEEEDRLRKIGKFRDIGTDIILRRHPLLKTKDDIIVEASLARSRKQNAKKRADEYQIKYIPLIESEISTEPIDKNIIIRKKIKIVHKTPKKAINYKDYNTNLVVDNWLNASVYGNLKSFFPKDYDNILNHFINQAKYNKRIFPATIFKVLNKDLIYRLKQKYSIQEMYEGAENLSIAFLEDDRIKVKDDGISDDFKNIQQYI